MNSNTREDQMIRNLLTWKDEYTGQAKMNKNLEGYRRGEHNYGFYNLDC